MIGVNKVILIGNLGKNPDVVTFPCEAKADGTTTVKKATFPLATTELHRNRDGEKTEVTEWHNVVCWRALADIAEKYFTKGKLLYVEGRLRTRNWEENGVKKYFTEIIADAVTMLGSRGDGKSTEQKVENAEPVSFSNPEPTPGDDLPF